MSGIFIVLEELSVELKMVTTRSQDKSPEPYTGDKRPHSKALSEKVDKPKSKKQQRTDPASTSASGQDGGDENKASDAGMSKIHQLISQHGRLPLSDTDLSDPESPKPETVLAMLLNAMLSSSRISHVLAAKTIALVIRAGYHKLDVLKESTWEERTKVLTEGGYTHYREKTATMMGDLAQLIRDKYDPDGAQNIKGLGDVGISIFFDTAQHVWPYLAPYVDPRSVKTAQTIGIGSDVQVLFQEVGKQPKEMCRLAAALTLDSKEVEFRG
ncbi:hypothetical protein GGR52DRAFT_572447 [Hypoxylon sp. FL1284]|nr:hypothetical protein GGR52DRAFT_572447 [Hypoxylon sp. FL1284]